MVVLHVWNRCCPPHKKKHGRWLTLFPRQNRCGNLPKVRSQIWSLVEKMDASKVGSFFHKKDVMLPPFDDWNPDPEIFWFIWWKMKWWIFMDFPEVNIKSSLRTHKKTWALHHLFSWLGRFWRTHPFPLLLIKTQRFFLSIFKPSTSSPNWGKIKKTAFDGLPGPIVINGVMGRATRNGRKSLGITGVFVFSTPFLVELCGPLLITGTFRFFPLFGQPEAFLLGLPTANILEIPAPRREHPHLGVSRTPPGLRCFFWTTGAASNKNQAKLHGM